MSWLLIENNHRLISNCKMGDKVKNTTIKNLFNTMEYGENVYNTNKAKEWFQKSENILNMFTETPNGTQVDIKNAVNKEDLFKLHVPEAVTIDNILSKAGQNSKFNETDPITRTKLLNKFANEIEKHLDLFVQIDILSRGILSKDTKASLAVLVQNLQFYATFPVLNSIKNPTWKPDGLSVALISDENPIDIFGTFLGPSLAAGYNVVIQCGPKIAPIAALLIEISIKAGFSDVIKIIPGDIDVQTIFTNQKVSIISVFDNLYKEKLNVTNPLNKKIINISKFKTSLIVFDDADLDSAADCAVEATWSYQGLQPWSLGDVLVQENILRKFVDKIKRKLTLTKIGNGDDQQADISYPIVNNSFETFFKILEAAQKAGVDIYKADDTTNNFVPVLIIGGNVFNNNVIKEEHEFPALRINAFRTINEAANLANNNRQGLGVAVFTEDFSLVNEIIGKLNASNIWINTHGIKTAEIAITPNKSSGIGYFGGKQGFDEYINVKTLLKSDNLEKTGNGQEMANALSTAKKAQGSWTKQTYFGRCQKLLKVFEYIINNKKSLSDQSIPEKCLNLWVNTIAEATAKMTQNTTILSNMNINTYHQPRGLIVIETPEDINNHNIKAVISAILEGNAVVLANSSKVAETFYQTLGDLLPHGILCAVPLTLDTIKTAALHKELNVYLAEYETNLLASLPIKDAKKFITVKDDWEDVLSKVTYIKNVWCSSGKSFA